MPFHFPDEQVVGYRDDDPIQEVNQKYLEAINLTYSYFPREIFYMRTLLNYVKRPHSYSQTRTTNNIDYPKFKEACYAMGLLNDDKVYIDANHAIVESSTCIVSFNKDTFVVKIKDVKTLFYARRHNNLYDISKQIECILLGLKKYGFDTKNLSISICNTF